MGKRYQRIRIYLRGIPLNGHIIFYRLNQDSIEILRVVKGNRDLEALFED